MKIDLLEYGILEKVVISPLYLHGFSEERSKIFFTFFPTSDLENLHLPDFYWVFSSSNMTISFYIEQYTQTLIRDDYMIRHDNNYLPSFSEIPPEQDSHIRIKFEGQIIFINYKYTTPTNQLFLITPPCRMCIDFMNTFPECYDSSINQIQLPNNDFQILL